MKNFKSEFIYFLILLLCGIYFLHGWNHFYFPTPWDEALHIYVTKFSWSELPLDRAPLYILFLKVLRYFEADPVRLFFLIEWVLSLALPLGIFLLALRFRVGGFASFLLGYLFLISNYNAPVLYSKASHFNLLYFVIGAWALTWVRGILLQLVLAGMLLFFSIYIRLDNLIVLLMLTAIVVFKNSQISLQRRGLYLAGFALICMGLVFMIGSPFSTSKSWDSFADWYYWAHHMRKGWFDVDLVANSRDIIWASIKDDFGDAESISQALVNNPSTFLGHTFENLWIWILNLPIWIGGHFPLSRGLVTDNHLISSLVETVLIFIFGWWLYRKHSSVRESGNPDIYMRALGWVTLSFLCKSLVTSLLLAPSPRYNLDFLVFFLILILAYFSKKTVSVSKRFSVGAVAVLVLLSPGHNEAFYKRIYSNEADSLYIETIEFIKTLETDRPVKILGASVIDSYLGRAQRSYTGADYLRSNSKQLPLSEAIEAKEIDVIVIDKKMAMAFKMHGKYEELLDYVAQSEKFGFKTVLNEKYKQDWPFIVLVRKSRLNK